MAEARQTEFYNSSMAAKAQKALEKSNSARSPIQDAAVRLFADGKPRAVVAKLLAPHLFPKLYGRNPSAAHRATRKKLRTWEETEWFRDAVYQSAVQHLDADIPAIFRGISRRAKKGRVDASRLALEVTGRHNPRGEAVAPVAINISFGGQIPRPSNRPTGQIEGGEAELVEAEIVDEEDAD